jgi:RNA recognition motif-containing protein
MAHACGCHAGGGLSWETSSERLRAYFENYGVVREAFVSVNRTTGRPRGFGFVLFESPEVAEKVVSSKHTIDRREVRGTRGLVTPPSQHSHQQAHAGHAHRG